MKNLIDLLTNSDWALAQDTLERWGQIIQAKLERGSIEEFVSRTPGQPKTQEPGYEIINGVGVIPVVGTLVKRSFFFDCGTTYSGLRNLIQDAVDDPAADSIMLDIDSPGGSASGCQELADFIFQVRDRKPIFAYANGQACSAAYWLASATMEIAASPTSQVGSIGVLTMHIDYSGMDKNCGVTRTYLTAGKFKAIGNDAEPLSDAARDYIQERLDQLYGIFVGDVARNRGVTTAAAERMADGRVFLAEPGRQIGLIDQVTGREDFLIHISSSRRKTMDLKELQAKHPDLVEQITQQAREGMVPQKAVADEHDRVLALHGALYGDEAATQFSAIVETGVTADQVTALKGALQVNQPAAEDSSKDLITRKEMLEAIQTAAADPVQTTAGQASNKDFEALIADYLAANQGANRTAALKAVAKAHPDLHQEWLKKQQK